MSRTGLVLAPDGSPGRPEVAALVQAEVEPVDLVPGRAQERHQDSPDVTAVTRDEDSHHYPQGSGYEFDVVA